MSLVLIRSALEVALAAMSPALATLWENGSYVTAAGTAGSPVPGTPYQRVFLLPAEPDNPEMGRFTRDQGILQVSLAYPLNAGPAAATARAELIRDTFYRGRTFTSGGLSTVIERTPEIAPGRVEEDRWVIPVKIRFYANYVA
jgi:hypothetical protein